MKLLSTQGNNNGMFDKITNGKSNTKVKDYVIKIIAFSISSL